ncbi:DUF397 domain-containing protein [Streptomyces rhizosphaericola]|uniref:DUF397 domain-containing protein n=1 Tax=Streptomyces TaxID=1883 RepID=UPI0013ECC75C|nr:DUF397 domain-containing protein [Streptomyces sp. 196(2019)]NGO86507.1 DUF397 domain-containing protein [Streptomyces sp. 196(2019)]
MDHETGHWFKSSFSGGSGTECVEITKLAMAVGIRDSTRRHGPRLSVSHASWSDFVASFGEQA